MSSNETERFLLEARRLARLQHPGIVAVHDAGVYEGQECIVSALVDGKNLKEWLTKRRPNWQEAARLAAAVADALSHAHARSIVHRDVKPSNIVLTAEGDPVLVDFGLALDDAQASEAELGQVSGTPGYMSPEQVAGAAHRIDGRTDIYSLGVVLYQTLCGRAPFRSSDTREMLRQVVNDEPQPPRQLERSIPSELQRVCLKAMAKSLTDRYTTASDFAEALRRIIRSDETSAPLADQGLRLGERSGVPEESAGEPRTDRPERPASPFRAREAERRQVTLLACGCRL